MPTYDYVCDACGSRAEFFHGISEAPPAKCPKCGKKGKLRKLISGGTGLIFKGSGFYITDYKKGKGENKSEGKKARAASSDSGEKSSGSGDSKRSEPKADSKSDEKKGSSSSGG